MTNLPSDTGNYCVFVGEGSFQEMTAWEASKWPCFLCVLMTSMLVSVIGQPLVAIQTLVGTECFGLGCNFRELKRPDCKTCQQPLQGFPLHLIARPQQTWGLLSELQRVAFVRVGLQGALLRTGPWVMPRATHGVVSASTEVVGRDDLQRKLFASLCASSFFLLSLLTLMFPCKSSQSEYNNLNINFFLFSRRRGSHPSPVEPLAFDNTFPHLCVELCGQTGRPTSFTYEAFPCGEN